FVTLIHTLSASSFSYRDSPRHLHSFPTRRSSDLRRARRPPSRRANVADRRARPPAAPPYRSPRSSARRPRAGGGAAPGSRSRCRSEEHTSELQSRFDLVCRLLLEKKKQKSTLTLN